MPNAWEKMISECKASAYYARKYSIDQITKNASVYLYHNGIGVIAKGIVTSTRMKGDCKEDKNEEFFVKLKLDWSIEKREWPKKAPSPRDINRKLNSGHRFRNTVFGISKKMATEIDSIADEKRRTI